MSTRRIRATINSSYVQPLKLATGRKLVLTPSAHYNSVLFTKKHKSGTLTDSITKAKLWAKFDGTNFDGVHLVAYLSKDDVSPIASGSCTFRVYYVTDTSTWTDTLIHTVAGTLTSGKWTAAPTQVDLGVSNELDGERTLRIEAELTRLGKTYKTSVYVNHLGIFDSLFRLKQEVEFLDITKQDE